LGTVAFSDRAGPLVWSTPVDADHSIIGRGAELETIAAAVADEAAAVVVHGGPGCGRSTVLRAATAAARASGATVVLVGPAAFDRGPPLRIWRTVVAGLTRGMGPRPAHGDGEPTAENVRRVAEQAAANGPAVVALDDVHLVDPPSAELLAELVERPPAGPVTLLLAAASGRLPSVVADALGGSSAAAEVELGPLADEASEALLGGDWTAEQRALLQELAGGAPVFLATLAAHARRDAMPSSDPWAEPRLPARVATTLRGELAALDEPAAQVARALAVAGGRADLQLIAAAADLPADAAADGLATLAHRRLVTLAGAEAGFTSLAAAAVAYETASEAFRLAAHGRAAAALAEASPADRAPHVERSAEPGDTVAVEALAAAATAVAAADPALAARWLDAAVGLLPEGQDPRREALLMAMAKTLFADGDLERCRAVLDRLRALGRERGAAPQAEAIGLAAIVEALLGDADGAAATLEHGLAEAGARPRGATPGRWSLHLAAATLSWLGSDWRRMTVEADIGLDIARRLGSPARERDAAAFAALAAYCADRPQAGDRLEVAIASIHRVGAGGLPPAVVLTALAAMGMERLATAERLLAVPARPSERRAGMVWTLIAAAARALVVLLQGRPRGARELIDRDLPSGGGDVGLMMGVWIPGVHGWASLLLGELDTALASATAARRAADASPAPGLRWLALGPLAATLLEIGEPDRAVAVLLGKGGGDTLSLIERPARVRWYELLVRAELARDDRVAASRWVAHAERIAVERPLDGRLAAARLAAAELAAHQDRPDRAAKLAGEAAAAFARAGQSLEAARAEVEQGAALAAAGRPAEARATLARAREDLDARGARLLFERADRALRAVGGGEDEGGALAGLTARELEVAKLVAEGLTNRELAERLFLSQRTVERHLARIFAKLDIPSRAALASLVVRARLDP